MINILNNNNIYKKKNTNLFGQLLCNLHNNEELYLTSTSSPFINIINNWKWNRPTDSVRIDAILSTLIDCSYVNSPIYVAEIIDKNKNNIKNTINYVVFDGAHRLAAFKKYNKQYDILFNITRNANFDIIKQKFLIFNKSIPVPELYQCDDAYDLKNVLEFIVNELSITFKDHLSSSFRPKTGNFNKDNLIDLLYNKYKNKQIDKNLLLNEILLLNDKYKNNNHINLKNCPITCINKSKRTGCFLFLKKDFTDDLINI